MKIYEVAVKRDDTVAVVSVNVLKETPQFYMIESRSGDLKWDDPLRNAFGGSWCSRIEKRRTHISARAALDAYIEKRQTHKANMQTAIDQATKQIASANELRMKIVYEPVTEDAVAGDSE